MIVVSDTSPISNLVVIGRVDILQNLFPQLVIPPKVLSEIQALQGFGVGEKLISKVLKTADE